MTTIAPIVTATLFGGWQMIARHLLGVTHVQSVAHDHRMVPCGAVEHLHHREFDVFVGDACTSAN